MNRLAFLWISLWVLSGCTPKPECHDATVNKTKDDFRRIDCPPCPTSVTQAIPPKAISPQVHYPKSFYQKVSLSLSGQIPLREAFYELARQANLNVILDSAFSKKGDVFYHAHEQPLIEVLENLCLIGGLRYSFDRNTLHVSQDTPYFKTHNVQFLLGFRKTQTQTSVKTDVFAEGLNQSQKGMADNGASITMNTCHTVDFWEELEKNIHMILCSQKENKKDRPPSHSLNKYAGILSVHGTEKQHRQISLFLQKIQKLVTAQILIEAKIIEIDLDDEYKGGINWDAFIDTAVKKGLPYPFMTGANPSMPSLPSANLPSSVALGGRQGQFTFSVNTNYLQALATFMEKFGTVRTLANPRQTVINNQAAILKVAHNEVFFELQIQETDLDRRRNNGAVIQRAQSRIQTVPIGLILYVHPSLNFETGDIIVSLHPTISRVVGTKSDPAAALYSQSQPVVSEVPIVQVREMDSVIVAKEGQVIVTGGLMEERSTNETRAVPMLSEIPGLGELFKYKEKKNVITELVILLKLSVVHRDQSNLTPADQRLYQEFTRDPRPLPLSR
jgi:MSHA type pilus biogenesis protein MshL